ncbi:hypothetical protein TNCV_4730891 [Trichonephila clavipes]|nr:hypothetical protein TNCV_4730891 [Trichonephila clavipes]
MATGSYLTPNYPRSQSEIQGDLHTVYATLGPKFIGNASKTISCHIVSSSDATKDPLIVRLMHIKIVEA